MKKVTVISFVGLMLGLMLLFADPSSATMVITQDTLSNLTATFIPADSGSSITGVNWKVGYDMSQAVTGQHTGIPHPGSDGGAGSIVSFLTLPDKGESITKSVVHGTHSDTYTLSFNGGGTLYTLTAVHVVPLPAGILFLAPGLLGLIGLRRRRTGI